MAANNLSTLVPALIGTIQTVARQTGFALNLTTVDATAEGAAQGQSVDYSELPEIVVGDVTPGPDPVEASATTTTKRSLILTEHKKAPFKLSAEDERGLASMGAAYRSASIDLAVGSLIDTISGYAAGLLVRGAGLAHGTPGTDPFATTPNILIDAWRTMADDKAPDFGRFAALSTLDHAGASKLAQFQKLNEAPIGTAFAQGRLGMLANWNVGYDQASGVLQTTTAAGGYLVNNASGYAAGVKAITVDTGTGGFAAGDVVTVAGNFEVGTSTLAQMVVESATATVVTFTRGLLSAVADNAAVVRIATHRSSILAHSAATVLAVRPSAEVSSGDKATIVQPIRDPVTGLSMRLAYYPGYHQGQWEISAVYGGIVRRPSWVRRIIR